MRKVIILLIIVPFLNSCLDKALETRKIIIINNSSKPIYCFISQNDSIRTPYVFYADSVIDHYYKVGAKKTVLLDERPRSWDNYIRNSENGKMRIFIVSNDSIVKFGWHEVLMHNNIIKSFKFDLNDLKNCDWQIVFDDNN